VFQKPNEETSAGAVSGRMVERAKGRKGEWANNVTYKNVTYKKKFEIFLFQITLFQIILLLCTQIKNR
jgi:hypothetical protein